MHFFLVHRRTRIGSRRLPSSKCRPWLTILAILLVARGLQAGAESYAYCVFLMSDKAVKYLETSKGWELGVGPSLVVVNEGVAKNLSTSTLKDDAYAFIFNQQGLMASLSIEGSKITRIHR